MIFGSTVLVTIFGHISIEEPSGIILSIPNPLNDQFVVSDGLLRIIDIIVLVLFVLTPRNDVPGEIIKTSVLYFLLQTVYIVLLTNKDLLFFILLLCVLTVKLLISIWLYYLVIRITVQESMLAFVFIVQLNFVWNIIVIYCMGSNFAVKHGLSVEAAQFLLAIISILIFCFMAGGFYYIVHFLLVIDNIVFNYQHYTTISIFFGMYCLLIDLMLLYCNIRWWQRNRHDIDQEKVYKFLKSGAFANMYQKEKVLPTQHPQTTPKLDDNEPEESELEEPRQRAKYERVTNQNTTVINITPVQQQQTSTTTIISTPDSDDDRESFISNAWSRVGPTIKAVDYIRKPPQPPQGYNYRFQQTDPVRQTKKE